MFSIKDGSDHTDSYSEQVQTRPDKSCPKCGRNAPSFQIETAGYCQDCMLGNFGAKDAGPVQEPWRIQSYDGRRRVPVEPGPVVSAKEFAAKFYDVEACLSGWMRWERRGSIRRLKPQGGPRSTEAQYIDVDLLQWLHVENFFRACPKDRQEREWLLKLPPAELKSKRADMASPHFLEHFREWYEDHPLAVVYTGDPQRNYDSDFECLPLSEAVDRWNVRAEDEKLAKHLSKTEKRIITLRAANEASKETRSDDGAIQPPKLATWSPEGKKHTTRNEICRWLETWPIQHGGARPNSGPKKIKKK